MRLQNSGDACEDLVGALAPGERLGIFVVEVQILANGAFELEGAAMRAALDLALADQGEPALGEVEPYAEITPGRWRLSSPVPAQEEQRTDRLNTAIARYLAALRKAHLADARGPLRAFLAGNVEKFYTCSDRCDRRDVQPNDCMHLSNIGFDSCLLSSY